MDKVFELNKKSNFNFFKIFSKITRFIRNRFSDDPLDPLKKLGCIGKIVASFAAKLVDRVIHMLSYLVTGLFYSRKRDSSCVGSVIYTISNVGIKKLFKRFFVFTLTFASMTQLVRFLKIDISPDFPLVSNLIDIVFH